MLETIQCSVIYKLEIQPVIYKLEVKVEKVTVTRRRVCLKHVVEKPCLYNARLFAARIL